MIARNLHRILVALMGVTILASHVDDTPAMLTMGGAA